MSLAELPKTAAEQCALGFLLRFTNASTRTGYRRSLKQFFEFCEQHEIEPLHATRVHIELWSRLLEAGGNKPATIAQKHNALAGFFKYAVIDEVITKNPMLHVARPKVPRESSTNYLTARELFLVLNAAEGSSLRLHSVLCLLGLNGLRISEALGLDVEDLGFERGYVTAKITRKGGKTQVVPLPPRTAWAIKSYLELDDRKTGPVFITSTAARVTRNQIGKELRTLCIDLGIKKRISPHSLRHSFVSIALDSNVPIRDVQNSTGHADSRLVSYYDRSKQSLDRNAAWSVAATVAGM